MPGFVGIRELAVLMLALCLIFGAKRLPEFGRWLGRSMREFKEGVTSKNET